MIILIKLEAIQKLDTEIACYQAIDFLNNYILEFYKKHRIFEKIYERGFYKKQESYDDRAYIRFEI